MFTDGGSFSPEAELTRMELGRALMFGARVPQFIPNQPSFSDVAVGTPDALVAESLKREGVMGVGGGAFGPNASVSRVEQAVALVRALRMDAQAKAKANTAVKDSTTGQNLIDNGEIPPALRGYVQIAIDKGFLEAFRRRSSRLAEGFVAKPPARALSRTEL